MTNETIVGGVSIGVHLAGYAYFLANVITIRYWVATSGTNSNTAAKDAFIELVNAAEDAILIGDDGDEMDGSIYQDQDVIDAVNARLLQKPDLRIHCLFWRECETAFEAAFSGRKGVEFSRTTDRLSIHFKIVDDGKIAYLSEHDIGEVNRRYTKYNFGGFRRFILSARREKMRILNPHIRKMEVAAVAA